MTQLRHPKLTADARKELTNSFARCKANHSHTLEPIEATGKPEFGIAVDQRCIHCGTVRRDIYSPFNGEVLARWYDHPDDYKELPYHTSGEWRLIWLRTLDRTVKRVQR